MDSGRFPCLAYICASLANPKHSPRYIVNKKEGKVFLYLRLERSEKSLKIYDTQRGCIVMGEGSQFYDFKEKIYFILRKKESMFIGFDFHSHEPFKVVVTDEIIDVFDYGTDQTARYHAVYV